MYTVTPLSKTQSSYTPSVSRRKRKMSRILSRLRGENYYEITFTKAPVIRHPGQIPWEEFLQNSIKRSWSFYTSNARTQQGR